MSLRAFPRWAPLPHAAAPHVSPVLGVWRETPHSSPSQRQPEGCQGRAGTGASSGHLPLRGACVAVPREAQSPVVGTDAPRRIEGLSDWGVFGSHKLLTHLRFLWG